MSRNAQITRQLRLLMLLMSGRQRLERLSELLGVTPRTLFRDLNALEEIHVPICRADYSNSYYIESKKCPLCHHAIKETS